MNVLVLFILAIAWPETGSSNPILVFSPAVGFLLHQTFGFSVALGAVLGILMVEGFVITTLDVAVRLNRYLLEELWQAISVRVSPFWRNFWVNSSLAVFMMWVLAYSNTFSALWPIFGTAKKLLAALTLIAVSVWLYVRSKCNWFTVWPAVFMILTTITSLIILLWNKYIPQENYLLIGMDLLLSVFALGVAYLALETAFKLVKVRALNKGLAT